MALSGYGFCRQDGTRAVSKTYISSAAYVHGAVCVGTSLGLLPLILDMLVAVKHPRLVLVWKVRHTNSLTEKWRCPQEGLIVSASLSIVRCTPNASIICLSWSVWPPPGKGQYVSSYLPCPGLL